MEIIDEIFECQTCGFQKDESDFKTDLANCESLDELTCEQCYDEMNNQIFNVK